jgi:oligopeptide/dipeptide ABC transporter ATP-binding protein
MADPTKLPAGCKFSDRCPYADDNCTAAVPPDVEIEAGHTVKCHRMEVGG